MTFRRRTVTSAPYKKKAPCRKSLQDASIPKLKTRKASIQVHNQSNTGFEHTSDTTTETKSKRPRRRAAHTIVRRTEAGDHTACGKFIARQNATPVKVDSNGVPLSVEYYPCPACRDMKRFEKEMKGHWPKFLIPADMALDLADRWEVKK